MRVFRGSTRRSFDLLLRNISVNYPSNLEEHFSSKHPPFVKNMNETTESSLLEKRRNLDVNEMFINSLLFNCLMERAGEEEEEEEESEKEMND